MAFVFFASPSSSGLKPKAASCQTSGGQDRFNAGKLSTIDMIETKSGGGGHDDDDDDGAGRGMPSTDFNGVQLTYSEGDSCSRTMGGGLIQRRTIVQFICDPSGSTDGPVSVKEAPTCTYTVHWPSPFGCPAGGLSHGWVFIILFTVFSTLYLVGGIVYKQKQLGVEGIESVPNIDMWRQLPSLVMDGVTFTRETLTELYETKYKNRHSQIPDDGV